ncbi:hypothetical protein [Amaricoccus sp.]|uniref:spike base protein, RCAP_Rcc01079 family n=1 Tax=Amaricoccus sp. TaxID=1872485 RepID=UPI0026071088|nr:hypothetical protein [uncultured Amaricoccus sp.]
MPDAYEAHQRGLSGPADRGFAITPHASNPLAFVTRALYVGGAGDLVLRLAGEAADITLAAVPAGTLLPLRVSHVRATSSATLLVALY